MTWIEIASDFEWDGSWRDIYVLDATIGDWQRVLDGLKELRPGPVMNIDGEAAAFQLTASAIFQQRERHSLLLYLTVGNVRLNCNFFQEDEVEFDFDPRQVKNPDDLESVRAFMNLLASWTGKTAILTHENTRSGVILAVSPQR